MPKIRVTIPDERDAAASALQGAVPEYLTAELDDDGLVRVAEMAEEHVPELVRIRRRIDEAERRAGMEPGESHIKRGPRDVEALRGQERQLLHRFAGEVVKAFPSRERPRQVQ